MMMNFRRWIILTILLVAVLAAAVTMAVLPETSPAGIVPADKILEMKYFHDLTGPEQANAPDMSGILSEYALITVDPAEFMNDADTNHEVYFRIMGTSFRKETWYRLHLVSVPPPVSPDAVLIVKNENGETRKPLPLVKQYRGIITGRQTGDAFFTVSDEVLLGRISVGGISCYLEQRGPGKAAGGKPIHILYRSEKIIQRDFPERSYNTAGA